MDSISLAQYPALYIVLARILFIHVFHPCASGLRGSGPWGVGLEHLGASVGPMDNAGVETKLAATKQHDSIESREYGLHYER